MWLLGTYTDMIGTVHPRHWYSRVQALIASHRIYPGSLLGKTIDCVVHCAFIEANGGSISVSNGNVYVLSWAYVNLTIWPDAFRYCAKCEDAARHRA